MTLTEAKAAMSSIGISLSKQDGEYRVAFKGTRRDDTYSEAYFTSDLADAVSTGRAMAVQPLAENLMPAHEVITDAANATALAAVDVPAPFKSPFKCLFCGETYEYGDPNHSHN